MNRKLSLKLTYLLLCSIAAAGCGERASQSGQPLFNPEPVHTESIQSEELQMLQDKKDLETGVDYYVQESLRVRSGPSTTDEILGTLNVNDKVSVVDALTETTDFVEIKIVSSKAAMKASTKYFVSFKYLFESPRTEAEIKEKATGGDNLFIIQNISTEMLRIYEKKCDQGVCKNKMVMEAELAVGENKPETKTVLGSFRISKWVKFYQDNAGSYPSWYDPNYPAVPEKGKGFGAWRDKKVMPNGKGAMRGAFGWYTALVGPNSYSQWTHGTIGWGQDKTKYIDITRNFFVNIVTDPRSHGCSRTDNESIAFIRNMIPVGTPIYKIYAPEKLFDASLEGYSKENKTWDYILTKNGVRVDGQKSDRAAVLAAKTPESQWLEEGSYSIDAYPEAKKLKDRYGAGKENIKGTFYPDVGLLEDYSHPATLQVGGSGAPMPDYVTYKLGAPIAKKK